MATYPAPPTLANARRLLGAARAALREYPNVIGVGVGLRLRQGKHTDEVCFVVSVSKKVDLSPRDLLPRRLFSIPVDVQEQATARLLAGVGAGGLIRRVGQTRFGHIGAVSPVAGGRSVAVTVLHVLADVTKPVNYPAHPEGYFSVETGPQSAPLSFGVFVEGAFNSMADIARVVCDEDVATSPGSSPIDLHDLALPTDAKLAVDGQAITGSLVQFPAAPVTVTIHGTQFQFEDAAAFQFPSGAIAEGWSGSAIVHPDGRILALLSCASSQGTSPQMAYGFNLLPYWQAWGLP